MGLNSEVYTDQSGTVTLVFGGMFWVIVVLEDKAPSFATNCLSEVFFQNLHIFIHSS